MKAAQEMLEKGLYNLGHFGDARLKKRCGFASAHGVATKRLLAATGGQAVHGKFSLAADGPLTR